MSDMAYVGVDPGLKSGLALLIIPTAGEPWFTSWEDDWESAVHWVDWIAQVDVMESGIRPDIAMVVVEDFIVNRETHKKTRHPEVVWAIGALKWLSRNRYPFTLQSPSVKAAVTATHLEAAGWRHPSSGHARDAARHLLAYCLRADIMVESFTEEGALRIEHAT